jgi:hypothetical protein
MFTAYAENSALKGNENYQHKNENADYLQR